MKKCNVLFCNVIYQMNKDKNRREAIEKKVCMNSIWNFYQERGKTKIQNENLLEGIMYPGKVWEFGQRL